MISQNDKKQKILGDKKLGFTNDRGFTTIHKRYKNLKINIQNSNGGLTSSAYMNTKNKNHSKKFFVFEQLSKSKKKKNILTETAYDEKKLFKNKNKFNSIKEGKSENSKSKNKTHIIKRIKTKINNSNKKINDNIIKKTPKGKKLIDEYSLIKINKLCLLKALNDASIYKYSSRDKLSKMPSSIRNYQTYSSQKKINNEIFNYSEKLLRSQPHIRNINIKSIYSKNENNNLRNTKFKTLINYDTSIDIKSLSSSKNYYQYTDIYQNLSFKLKAKNKEKPFCIKKKDIKDFETSLTNINEESSKQLKLKNINNKGSKIINFLDLIKMKQKKIRKCFEHKSNKIKNSNKGNCSEDNSKLKYILSKTNNNSIRSIDSSLKKRSFRSCDIPLKIKKIKKEISIIPLFKFAKSDKIIKHKYPTLDNDKINIFNESKNKKKEKIQIGSNMEKESSYIFLEPEPELNQKLINEIKINNFDVNKPKEQNMKYTLYKEFKEENENENESSKPESHISKIIIGEIESYKDIIEKDRKNYKKNKDELITVPVDDSIESEKFIINMINFGNNETNSSLFSNEFKNNISNEKTINYNLKNNSFYPSIQYIKKTSNNNIDNTKGAKIKIEKKSERNSKNKLKKKYPKIIKKVNIKSKKNDGNILCKSNSKINSNKNINISNMKRAIASPFNNKEITTSKDSIERNKNNLISKFIDESNKKDENCSIY